MTQDDLATLEAQAEQTRWEKRERWQAERANRRQVPLWTSRASLFSVLARVRAKVDQGASCAEVSEFIRRMR